ncbi:A/G-specific DNA-adenine glycosylase [Limnobacter thiooxidans]|nr:A/G-specific DNA-adenine glycosylase [Limnobacter thiooxidans]
MKSLSSPALRLSPASHPMKGEQFAAVLVNWQTRHGRQTLPWQHTGDAYKVWLSEIMLQQTQVTTVLTYYEKLLNACPKVSDLAAASQQDVMQLWAGLGYYTRARNLHACAQQVVERFGGVFPRDVADLESLPGIGRSTAGAIASLAYGVQAPILDGNVKRVFCRYYGVEGYPEQSAVKKQLWLIAETNVPRANPGQYNQALMDLGATRCTPRNPDCRQCPLNESCVALSKGQVNQLPTPKPKKERPELYFISLLVQDETRALLLDIQPDKGVWQGLWTPPCVPCDEEHQPAALLPEFDQILSRWGLSDAREEIEEQLQRLQGQSWLVHELTHRKMHFKVLALKRSGFHAAFHQLSEKPVPRIVHKLLEQAGRLNESPQSSMAQQDTLDF